MGRACSTNGENRNAYRILWENQKGRERETTRKNKKQMGGKY
jgi:hypothetical protein